MSNFVLNCQICLDKKIVKFKKCVPVCLVSFVFYLSLVKNEFRARKKIKTARLFLNVYRAMLLFHLRE